MKIIRKLQGACAAYATVCTRVVLPRAESSPTGSPCGEGSPGSRRRDGLRVPLGGVNGYKGVRGKQGRKKNKFQGVHLVVTNPTIYRICNPPHAFDGRFSRRSRRRRPHSRRMDVCARHHSSALDVPTASVDIIRRARSVVVAQGSVAGASQQRGGLLASSAAERHERISCCDSCRRRLPPSPHQAEGPRRAATGRRRPAGSRGRVALSGSRVDDVDIWSMCTCCVVE